MTPRKKPEERKELGRNSKYTPQIVEEICKYASAGVSNKEACDCVGVSQQTLYVWLAKYPDFSEKLEQARSRGLTALMIVVNKAANEGDWRAAAWKLERQYPDRFAPRTRTEVTGKNGGPVQHSILVGLPDMSQIPTHVLLEFIRKNTDGDTRASS